MKLLKFLVVVTSLYLIYRYIPYGIYFCTIVHIVALWKLVNDD